MRISLAALALVLVSPPARAHDGPPYPLFVERDVGGRALSVWADPDVGEGTFYLYLPCEEDAPERALTVRLETRALDGGPGDASVVAERAQDGLPYQRVARVDFPRRGDWNVRFVLESPEGASVAATDVEVTPPGLGKLDLVWYSAPFFLLGFVWLRAFAHRRAHAAGASCHATHAH